MAAGGLRVSPDRSDVQFFVREPLDVVAPKNYSVKHGFFNCDNDVFSIDNRCEKAVLALDGQHGRVELNWGDIVEFNYAQAVTIAQRT